MKTTKLLSIRRTAPNQLVLSTSRGVRLLTSPHPAGISQVEEDNIRRNWPRWGMRATCKGIGKISVA